MSKLLSRNDVEYIVVHCSATPPDTEVNISDIDRWHRERGFFKVGYHLHINRQSELQFGRELYEIGAHAKGYNSKSIGVCIAGGVDEDNKPENNFKQAQLEVLYYTIQGLLLLFPNAVVIGHGELPDVNKSCPCFNVSELHSLAFN